MTKQVDLTLDIRLRTLLATWKQGRRFRAVGAHHYRKRTVPHGSQTELNREFANRRQAGGAAWLFFALLALAAIDYFYLRTYSGL
jgi:hypothetical protein